MLAYVAAQLGHAKPTTTLARYAHWIPTDSSVRYVDALDCLSADESPIPSSAVLAPSWHQTPSALLAMGTDDEEIPMISRLVAGGQDLFMSLRDEVVKIAGRWSRTDATRSSRWPRSRVPLELLRRSLDSIARLPLPGFGPRRRSRARWRRANGVELRRRTPFSCPCQPESVSSSAEATGERPVAAGLAEKQVFRLLRRSVTRYQAFAMWGQIFQLAVDLLVDTAPAHEGPQSCPLSDL